MYRCDDESDQSSPDIVKSDNIYTAVGNFIDVVEPESIYWVRLVLLYYETLLRLWFGLRIVCYLRNGI